MNMLFSQLVADACEGADGSPGNAASAWAVVEIERLTAELAKFQHHIACQFQVTGGLEPCDCGLDDAERRAGDHAEEIVRLAAKCDRLVAERDLLKREKDEGWFRCQSQAEAERDRLRAERNDYCRQLTQGIRAMRDVCLERDRLRASLAEAQTHHDILHPNCDAELRAAGVAGDKQ